MSAAARPPRPAEPFEVSGHTNGPGRLLTADDLAARWQVPASQVYRLTRAGRLPVVKLGRYYRYRLDAVEELERGGGAANE